MRSGDFDFGHMAAVAPAVGNPATLRYDFRGSGFPSRPEKCRCGVATGALGIGRRALLRQIEMGVVTCRAGKPRIVGIMSAAARKAVRLKTYVGNSPEIGHHPHRIRATMAGTTEFLVQCIWIERLGIENEGAVCATGLHNLRMQ